MKEAEGCIKERGANRNPKTLILILLGCSH